MSKLTESFKQLRIFNEWDFAGHGNVYITFIPQDNGRGGHGSKYQVIRPGFKTDSNGPWYEYGHKTFTPSSHRKLGTNGKAEALAEAKKWAGDRYGILEWDKTPYGSWMDAALVDARVKELKHRIAAGEVAAL
jgi:hypothetical protein